MWRRSSRGLRVASLVAGLSGVVLFAWSMRQAGTTAVIDGFKRVGGGIVVVIALGGVPAAPRPAARRMCLDPADHFPFRSMFAAYLARPAIAHLTPSLSLIINPPT